MLRIFVAEPQAIIRYGLQCLLQEQPDVEVIGTSPNAEAAIRQMRDRRPDVLLLSKVLVPRWLATAQALSTEAGVPLPVVVLVNDADRHTLEEMIQQGIAVLVSRDDEPEILLGAIRAAARGEQLWLSPGTAARLVRRDPEPEALNYLSARERELLVLAARGKDNAEIGSVLHIAPGTVRNRLSGVYAKLGVRDRAEATAWAWHFGLVQPQRGADR